MALRVPTPHCPHCPYTYVRPTTPRWYEWPMLLVLLRPFRCQSCDERMIRFYDPLRYLYAMLRDRVL